MIHHTLLCLQKRNNFCPQSLKYIVHPKKKLPTQSHEKTYTFYKMAISYEFAWCDSCRSVRFLVHPISISLSLSVEQKHVNEQFVQIYET